jgi:SAM-dependent methyltransferase
MTTRRTCVALLAVLVALGSTLGSARGQQRPPPASEDRWYIPNDMAERLLELAGVTSTDVVYDLGCGDGRIAIAAARKYGARAVGVDSDPERIALATASAQKAGVSHLVRFVRQDTIDFSEATVVTLAMPQSAPWLTNFGLIADTLAKQLRPGSRVVSTFLPGSLSLWKPTRVDRFADARGEPRAILYLWHYDGAPPR